MSEQEQIDELYGLIRRLEARVALLEVVLRAQTAPDLPQKAPSGGEQPLEVAEIVEGLRFANKPGFQHTDDRLYLETELGRIPIRVNPLLKPGEIGVIRGPEI